MCCLFGLIDYKGGLSYQQRKRIIRALAIEGEQRGTDATGYAWYHNGRIIIKKSSKAAHEYQVHMPKDVKVVMGHTRLTTQGNYHDNRNNHPFMGHCKENSFALAHNGIIYDDMELKKEYHLPQSKVETDSYVAVQLLEQSKKCNMESMQQLGNIIGNGFNMFNFSVLDDNNNLYLIKGNNPLAIYHFKEEGFILYASTKEIAERAMRRSGIDTYPEAEEPKAGTIWKISPKGNIEVNRFEMKEDDLSYYSMLYRRYYYEPEVYTREQSEYFKELLEYAKLIHFPTEELLELWEEGLDEEEIESILVEEDMLRGA
ncbi:class II glutamine amidotransferase [Negativibacillus massiliensis]|uniref:class II glutamine amidotransferase n=1 Tax=Negativibacillus massiliensis TaxID=1871035 RepID=UPI003AF24091